MASQVNGYIGKLNPGNGTEYSLGSTAYGVCSTAANEPDKTVEMTGFTLMTGATIFVKFTNTNSASNPTLSVNSTTAKSLVKYGSSTINWSAGAVLCLTYDGTNWVGTSVTLQDLGLANAMHFIGIANATVSDGGTENPMITGYDFTNDRKPGDVIIGNDDGREYVWTITGQWELLGQDASTTVDSGAPATNTWVSRVQQNSDRTITVTTGTLDTSGTWSGKLSKTFKVKLNNTQYTYDGSANVDLSTIYAPTAGGTANTQALVGNGTTATPKWVNINPTSAWTAGGNNGADGPSLKITVLGQTQSTGAVIPSAGAGASGVVTTGAQQFDGNKTFKGNVSPQANNTYDLGTSSLTWKNLYVRNIIFDSADSSTEANRIVWTDSNKKLVANNHYADATHIAINTETAPTENFYVEGTSRFSLGSSNDTTADKKFIIGSSGYRYLSFGGAGVQAYDDSDAVSALRLNYYGGNVSVGSNNSGGFGIRNNDSTTGIGISLYSGPNDSLPIYGLAFSGTATYGDYRGVPGGWATYLTTKSADYGWIFKRYNSTVPEGGETAEEKAARLLSGNVASISARGVFAGSGHAVVKGDYAATITIHNDVSLTANRSHYLPNATGWLAVGGNGSSQGVGNATQPIYLNTGGVLTATTYELKATVNNGTQNQLAYYSTNTAISSTPHITRGDYSLKITGDASNASQYQVTNGTHTISLHQAAGGNRGIYQNSSSEWLLYWPNTDTTAYINQNGGNVQIGKSGNTSSNLILYGTLYLRRSAASTAATSPGRISWYGAYGGSNNYTWYDYVSDATNGMCPTGGKPSTPENVTSWAKRSLVTGSQNYGWVWEAASNTAAASTTTQPTAIFSISAENGRALLNTSCDTNNYAGSSFKIVSNTSIASGEFSHGYQFFVPNLGNGGGVAGITFGKRMALNEAAGLLFKTNTSATDSMLSLGFVNNNDLLVVYPSGGVKIKYGASGYPNANSVYSLRLGADIENHLDLGYDGMQSQLANNGGANNLYLNYAGGNVIAGSNSAGGSLCVRNTSGTTGAGISFYGNGPAVGDLPTYGIALAGSATFGTHDGATHAWATYFTTQYSGTGRGWIFKAYNSANKTSGNVASIRATDGLLFNCGISLRHPNIPGQWCGDFYISTVGTETTEGRVYLRVGNGVAAGTAGNEKGQLVLYGSGVNYTAITTNATANTAVTFPATVSGQVPLLVLPVRTTFTDGGTWTLANFNIRSQTTPATSDYYLPMMNQNGATYLSDVLRTSVRIYNGTTEGYAGLLLGNNIPTGTAGAAHGYIYIYTTGSASIGISGQQGALDGTNTVDYLNINNNLKATKVWGSVYNDYAEFRKTETVVEPGRCVKEIGDDSLEITVKRLERGCEIVSDTYGFAIGATESAKTPIASSGRVLAYPYESREEFASHIGWPVCSGPNGTVSIMTEEEEEKYPSRIIGTISAVPDYEEWGEDNIKVNGRVWIRIR